MSSVESLLARLTDLSVELACVTAELEEALGHQPAPPPAAAGALVAVAAVVPNTVGWHVAASNKHVDIK